MPEIQISDATTQKLQKLAVPLTDTYETVISRLADAALQGIPYPLPSTRSDGVGVSLSPGASGGSDAKSRDSLTHTKLLRAEFDGVTLPYPNWNSLAKLAHETAAKKLGSFDELQGATTARVKPGRYEEDGFVYLPEVKISLQGTDANKAWESIARLARAIGVRVDVEFVWRDNPKAAKPGQKGHLSA